MGYPDQVVITIPSIDKHAVAMLTEILCELGYMDRHIHVISRSESFIYYVMSQNRDISNNNVGLFVLEDAHLTYYEMKVQHNPRNTYIYADTEVMDEGFNLEILSTSSGAKLGDKILTSCAERLMHKKIYSAVILTGKGFEEQSWAPNFMRYICSRRKVFVDREIFARGAGYRGVDFAGDKPVFSFICICDGRIDSTVTLEVTKDDRNIMYPLAGIGDTWYRVERELVVIPDNVNELEINVIPLDNRKRKVVRIPLDNRKRKVVRIPLSFLPQRPAKTGKVRIRASFADEHTLVIDLKDEGFGELFPATDAHLRQEVRLWD